MAHQLDMFRPEETLEELIEEIRVRRLGRIRIQKELDLRIKCPVTGEMKIATPQLSHMAYRIEQEVGAYQAWQMMVDRESR
jgi:hypothetical protein